MKNRMDGYQGGSGLGASKWRKSVLHRTLGAGGSWVVASGLTMLGLVAFFACDTPHGHIEVGAKYKDIDLSAHMSNDGHDWSMSGLPSDLCMCITFTDDNGNTTGHGRVEHGHGGGAIPPGTTGWHGDQVDCSRVADCTDPIVKHVAPHASGSSHQMPDDPGAPDGSGSSMVSMHDEPSAPQQHLVWQRIVGGTIDIDEVSGGLTQNARYDLDVLVQDLNSGEGFLTVWPLLLDGPGTPVPSSVRINHYAQISPTVFGGRILFADNEPFHSLRVNLNGIADYAVLGQNVSEVTLANDWHVVEVDVPFTDIHGLGSANIVESWTRSGDDPERYDSQSYLFSQ